VTLLSVGTPMFLMGDEVRQTQRGNNNAYCQDNEISWFDWTVVKMRADMLRFVRLLVARRVLREKETELKRGSLEQLLREARVSWHGVKVGHPDWSNHSHSLALGLEPQEGCLRFHAIFNAYWEALDFELPVIDNGDGGSWRRWIDTTLDSPFDIVEWQKAPPVDGRSYRAGPRSVVVLLANQQSWPET
jgi:isoamylase